jgi:hypothetical protein
MSKGALVAAAIAVAVFATAATGPVAMAASKLRAQTPSHPYGDGSVRFRVDLPRTPLPGVGVLRSSDGGRTWSMRPAPRLQTR